MALLCRAGLPHVTSTRRASPCEEKTCWRSLACLLYLRLSMPARDCASPHSPSVNSRNGCHVRMLEYACTVKPILHNLPCYQPASLYAASVARVDGAEHDSGPTRNVHQGPSRRLSWTALPVDPGLLRKVVLPPLAFHPQAPARQSQTRTVERCGSVRQGSGGTDSMLRRAASTASSVMSKPHLGQDPHCAHHAQDGVTTSSIHHPSTAAAERRCRASHARDAGDGGGRATADLDLDWVLTVGAHAPARRQQRPH